MFDKKEDESRLPDLPPLNMKVDREDMEIPEDREDREDRERHELPSFPDSPHKKGFSQTAIKEAVKEEKDSSTMEMEEWEPETHHQIPRPPREQSEIPTMEVPQKNANVFVQITKFHTAKKSIETAKEKLEEIEDTLKKIRESKLREEQELSAWEKEVANVTAKIKEVSMNIFEKMDVCQRL